MDLPAAVREFYELAGRRKQVWSNQEHFLEPEQLQVKNNRLIVCIENQGVVRWAIPLKKGLQDDPPVFVSDPDDRNDWIEEVPSFSVFALSQMLLNVKFSESTTLHANGQATDESLAMIQRSFRRLGLPDLHWPPHPTRLYGGTDLIIETNADTWIWVSGLSAETFHVATAAMARAGVEWT